MKRKQKTPQPRGRQIGAQASRAKSPWGKGPHCCTPRAAEMDRAYRARLAAEGGAV